jgi:hypothetical protein
MLNESWRNKYRTGKSCGYKASPRKEGRQKGREGESKGTRKEINDIRWPAPMSNIGCGSQRSF